MTSAGFNRRMRKTACPVVWKGHGAKLPVSPSDPFTCTVYHALGSNCLLDRVPARFYCTRP